MNILIKLWTWLWEIFTKEKLFHALVTEELPEQLNPGIVYLVGENDHFWCAAFLCPCGCQAVIQLNLLTTTRPVWRFERHQITGLPSLSPSILKTKGCKSHFFLLRGRIHWCTISKHPHNL